MKSLAWKLATLAAVIGIGFLVLLQAQRGMNQAMLSKQAESQAAAPAPATTPSAPAVASKNSAEQGRSYICLAQRQLSLLASLCIQGVRLGACTNKT